MVLANAEHNKPWMLFAFSRPTKRDRAKSASSYYTAARLPVAGHDGQDGHSLLLVLELVAKQIGAVRVVVGQPAERVLEDLGKVALDILLV